MWLKLIENRVTWVTMGRFGPLRAAAGAPEASSRSSLLDFEPSCSDLAAAFGSRGATLRGLGDGRGPAWARFWLLQRKSEPVWFHLGWFPSNIQTILSSSESILGRFGPLSRKTWKLRSRCSESSIYKVLMAPKCSIFTYLGLSGNLEGTFGEGRGFPERLWGSL